MTDYYAAARIPVDLDFVREQLFLLAHDEERHLRPRVHLPALSVGLAGAALVDLMVAGQVHIVDGQAFVSAPYRHQRAADPVTDHVLQLVRTLESVPLMVQLRQLGPGLYERTLGALTARGVITQHRTWGRTRHELVGQSLAVRTRAKVRYRISDKSPQHAADSDALCVLIWALNLQDCLIFGVTRAECNRLLAEITAQLPEWTEPSDPIRALPDVARAVRDAVGELAVSAF